MQKQSKGENCYHISGTYMVDKGLKMAELNSL